MIHLSLHLAIPFALAYGIFDRTVAARIFLILVATMLVDIDHLLADPIYDPERCSIGFHPLHSYIPIGCYGLLTLISATRYIGLGLLIHMALDLGDCVSMGLLP